MSATINVTGPIFAPPGTLQVSIPQIVLPAPVLSVLPLLLSSGNNTVNVPTGATLFFIQPPVSNSTAIALKSVNGDSNTFRLHNTLSSGPFCVDPSVTSFVLNAGAGFTTPVYVTFC